MGFWDRGFWDWDGFGWGLELRSSAFLFFFFFFIGRCREEGMMDYGD